MNSLRPTLFFCRTRVQSLATPVTHSLTLSLLLSRLDVTLVSEGTSSILAEVNTVADVDVENVLTTV